MDPTENQLTWKLRPVLSECYTEPISTMQVYVSTILDTKLTGKIIETLNSKFPDKNLLHLKRVHKMSDLKVILTSDSKKLPEISEHLKDLNLDTPTLLTVPKTSARTRKQFDEAMKFWPLSNFCADKYIEKTLNDRLFDYNDKLQFENLMKIAIKAAEKSIKLGGKGIGAIIVFKGQVLAIGCDARNLHPLKHATMAAIDMIAWLKQSKSYTAPAWIGNDISEYDAGIVQSPESYLCTDYDVFLTREPCSMCAMALLHNRAKRIFFGCSYENGGLETLVKLHTLPDINHRYQVFAGVLENQCENVINLNLCNGVLKNHKCFS